MTEKMCSKCKVQPSSPYHRWCKDCRKADARIRRIANSVKTQIVPIEERVGLCTGVYFIACHGFVKIGISVDVTKRYNSIKNANPLEVRPLAFIPTQTLAAAQAREQELHRLFDSLWHRGEWFRDGLVLRDYIREHTQHWPMPTEFDDEMFEKYLPYLAFEVERTA